MSELSFDSARKQRRSERRTVAARPQIAFPLDVADAEEARGWVERLGSHIELFKVGLERFCASGWETVYDLQRADRRCFLDLKLHDIPATVQQTVATVVERPVEYLTVHASGGISMMRAAAEAASSSSTKLLAVTVLTSMDAESLHQLGLGGSPEDLVLRLTEAALASGITGVVCSPHECAMLRQRFGVDVELVVPGIRPLHGPREDQKRVATLQEAVRNGANVVVVGRALRLANDPVDTARLMREEIDRVWQEQTSAMGAQPSQKASV